MPVNNETDRFKLQLPNEANTLKHDVARLISSFTTLENKAAILDADGHIVQSQFNGDVVALRRAPSLYIDDDCIPKNIPRMDDNNKILDENLNDDVKTVIHKVVSETAMVGLTTATPGDICQITTNPFKVYVLIDTDPTNPNNWREQVKKAVTSVNGATGDVTVAVAGENNDITSLTALSGPLKLGGDAGTDNEAVTLKQLRAATGGAGGANMSGIMNNFIGAVEWFQGSRAKLPAGYVAADGQTLTRAEYPDLWTAISIGMLNTVSEEIWLDGTTQGAPKGQFRGLFTIGDGTTTFRIPDLNGAQADSIRALFLRGDAAGQANATLGGAGQIIGSAAPNLYAQINFHGSQTQNQGGTNLASVAGGGFGAAIGEQSHYTDLGNQFNAAAKSFGAVVLDASKASPVYGRLNGDSRTPANEVRPNSVTGMWIIRANGSFTAGSTSFSVIKADAAEPQTGYIAHGGTVESNYTIAGITRAASSLITTYRWGDPSPQLDLNCALYDAQGNFIRGTGMSFGGGMLKLNNRPDGTGTDAAPSSVAFNAGNFWNANVYSAYAPIVGGGGGVAGGGYRGFVSFGALCPANGSTTHPTAVIANTWDWDTATGISKVPSRSALFVSETFDIQYMRNDGTETYTFTKNGTSDERMKHNITDYDPKASLAKIDDLVFKSFIYNNDEQNRLRRGVIAQQAEIVDPLYVKTRQYPSTHGAHFEQKELDSNALLLDALAAIQALSGEVKDLKAQLAAKA